MQILRDSIMRIEALTLTIPTEVARKPLPKVRGSVEPTTAALARIVLESLDDSKAEDVVTIDLNGKTSIADSMIIATGRSSTHVGAIAHRVIESCKASGHGTPRVEGIPNNDWVLVDANDIIIHIFRPEVRQFYNLEKMWSGDRPGEPRLA